MSRELTTEDAELVARMNVLDLADGQSGRLRVEHFEVPGTMEELARTLYWYGDRAPNPGPHVRLVEVTETVDPESGHDWFVWMSNTRAELEDHLPMMRRMAEPDCERVLINGLGLGTVLAGALSFDHIERVEVVEYDADVIALVGPHFDDERLTIHHEDAYSHVLRSYPVSDRFDAVWHDIWPDMSTSNLKGMAELQRKYEKRAYWQGFWAVGECRKMWEIEQTLLDTIKQVDGHYPRQGHPTYRSYLEHRGEAKAYAAMKRAIG